MVSGSATLEVMYRKFLILSTLVFISGGLCLLGLWLPQFASAPALQTALAVTVSYLVCIVIGEEVLIRRVSDNKTRYSIRKAMSLLLLLTIVVIALRIWVPNPQALLVAYGVIGAGLAVALQDVVKNLAGSIFIFFSGTYRVGNRVELNGTFGDVIDIGLFTTTLLEVRGWIDADQATGRIVTVPNGSVLSQPVYNYTKHHKYLWDEIAVVVTAESNWGEAMRILSEIAQEHTAPYVEAADKSLTRLERYYYVEGHMLEPNVYVQPGTDGYQLTLRYVVDAWKRRSTASNIWGHVIRVFDERDDIYIAPPTLARLEYPMPPRQ